MYTVLVTGCSSGFGKHIALSFARHGHRVYATLRDPAVAGKLLDTASGAGGTLSTVTLDVTDGMQVEKAVAAILAESGRIDVLVNNAGIAIPGALEDLSDEDIEQTLRTNFLGPLRLTRAVLPGMRAARFGRVIMISSLSALVGLPTGGIYSASKAALEAAAEGLRFEVDRFGVAVSVVEPGLFRTGMPEKILAAHRDPPGSAYSSLSNFLGNRALARMGEGDDPALVGELVVRIAEDPAPAFRYPAGAQAERVVEVLHGLADKDRGDFIRGVQDTGWWSTGEPGGNGER